MGFSSGDGKSSWARPLYGLGFRSGSLLHFYSHSLYWLLRHVGPMKTKVEVLKDGEVLIYGEMARRELKRLEAEGLLGQLRHYCWGVSWPFMEQRWGGEDDFSGYPLWREQILADIGGCVAIDSPADALPDPPEPPVPPRWLM